MKRTIFVAGAALALAACGNMVETASELQGKAGAAVEERAVAEAVVSAVDEKAVQNMVEGAAGDALREALPTGDIAALRAVIDEGALITGLDQAVDGEALGSAVRNAVEGARARMSATAAESVPAAE